MKCLTAFFVSLIFLAPALARADVPVIDMHLHAHGADVNGPPPTHICPGGAYPVHDPTRPWPAVFGDWLRNPPCREPLRGSASNDELMTETLEILRRRNVFGVTSGPYLEHWREAGGDRIIPALSFTFQPNDPGVDKVTEMFAAGRYEVFAEVAIQYAGVSPDDPKFEPYLAAAEELDVPVGIHIGTGPPGAPAIPGMEKYRARLHSALVLEEALVRHPELRVYVMHAGWPMLDDMLAIMWAYPRVHVDTGILCYALPRKEFYLYFRRIVDAGFGKRIMFGSDQMNWPGAIESCIDAIDSADFLSQSQKRDVLYNNAARFLRLSQEEIARHHEQ